jgi:hypothetical protein
MKYRVYFTDLDGFKFTYREFSNERVAKAYMAGMKNSLPDYQMTLEVE